MGARDGKCFFFLAFSASHSVSLPWVFAPLGQRTFKSKGSGTLGAKLKYPGTLAIDEIF